MRYVIMGGGVVVGTKLTLSDFQCAWSAAAVSGSRAGADAAGGGAAGPVGEAAVAGAVARIRALACTDPERYRRTVAGLARLVNEATGGRIVAEIDQLEGMALDAGAAYRRAAGGGTGGGGPAELPVEPPEPPRDMQVRHT